MAGQIWITAPLFLKEFVWVMAGKILLTKTKSETKMVEIPRVVLSELFLVKLSALFRVDYRQCAILLFEN